MPLDKILGYVEITRAYTGRLGSEYYGGKRYENVDFFASIKGQCLPQDAEEASEQLFEFARDEVITAMNREIDILSGNIPESPPAPEEVPSVQVSQQQTPPPPAPENPYPVVEKPAQAPATPTTTAPAQAQATKPSKVLADRLKERGLTTEQLSFWVDYFFGDNRPEKPTQEHYVEAFKALEEWLQSNSVETFQKWYAQNQAPATPQPAASAATPAPATEAADPAFEAARKQVIAKFGKWPPELAKLGALWCVEQMKDVGVLESVLAGAGITDKTPQGRVEAFLAITRHLTINSAAGLLAYSSKTGKPLSMIEAELSDAVKQPIRDAVGLPPNAVMDAFTELTGGA